MSKVMIAGHDLTQAQLLTLNEIQDHLRKHPETRYVHDIFPKRNNLDNARRRTAHRLAEMGVLKACGIELLS